MQKDMRIKRYSGEKSEFYIGRLIYSALCHWMRHVILDETTPNRDRKSKTYILKRMRKILNSMENAFPECNKWLHEDLNNTVEDEDIIRNLRDKMLAAGELSIVDDSNNIGLPDYKKVTNIGKISRIVGLSLENNREEFVGITRILQTNVGNNTNNAEYQIDIDQYLKDIYENSCWGSCNDINSYEFFNPFSKKPPYQSWSNHLPKCDMVLARLTLFNGLQEYHLLKKVPDGYQSAPLNNLFTEWKEERRILLVLRKLVGNPMEARYEQIDNIYLLYLYCGIPTKEQVLLDTYCWPLNSINDKYSYVVPEFIWETIKSNLKNCLGINLKEKS